jgi:hypothetical protein
MNAPVARPSYQARVARRSLPAWLLRAIASDVLVAPVTFAVYLATLAPGVVGFDSAEFATGAYTLGIVHPTGYPLYLLLAKLFTFLPVGSVAYRVNLLSACSASVTAWLVARLAVRLTGKRWAAWLAAGLLAFSISYWRMAVVAEVYTLHAVFTALLLWLLERLAATGNPRWLDRLALVFGLSMTNHVSTVFFAPAIALVVLRVIPIRALLRNAPRLLMLLVLGLTPYLYFPLRSASNPALNYVGSYYQVDLGTLEGMWWMVSGQAYRFFAFGYDLIGYGKELLAFGAQLLRNYTGVGVVLGVLGVVHLMRRRSLFAWASVLPFLLTVSFYAGYAVADKSTMFLGAYLIWALWIAEGAAVALRAVQRLGSWVGADPRRLGLVARAAFGMVVAAMCLANWGWADLSDHHDPEIFALQALGTLQPDAVVVGPWSTAVILEYYQIVEGMRPDVVIINRSRFEVAQYYSLWRLGLPRDRAMQAIAREEAGLLARALDRGPVYMLEYDPRFAAEYEYLPVGNLFRLVPRKESAS